MALGSCVQGAQSVKQKIDEGSGRWGIQKLHPEEVGAPAQGRDAFLGHIRGPSKGIGAPALCELDLRGARAVSREYYGLSSVNKMGGESGWFNWDGARRHMRLCGSGWR